MDQVNNWGILTDFIKSIHGKHGGDWSTRIIAQPLDLPNEGTRLSLMFYFGLEGRGELYPEEVLHSGKVHGSVALRGETPELGSFVIRLRNLASNEPIHFFGRKLAPDDAWRAKDHVQHVFRTAVESAAPTFSSAIPDPQDLYVLPDKMESGSNFYVFQVILEAEHQKYDVSEFGIEVDYISFNSAEQKQPEPSQLLDNVLAHGQTFDERFERTFGIKGKGYSDEEDDMAKAALGNTLGGLAYFHGRSIVDRSVGDSGDYIPEGLEFVDRTPNPQETEPKTLFTAVPSRPVFPRGFLWDEGFHQLLIGAWDLDISFDVIQHWFSLVDEDGWVAREQILGAEARSKVPPEFQVQIPTFANPPTLFLALRANLERLEARRKGKKAPELVVQPVDSGATIGSIRHEEFQMDSPEVVTQMLTNLYPMLRHVWTWFRTTQNGNMKMWGRNRRRNQEGYRWRGRTLGHTLPSGFDDYPRGPPHIGELHLDLLCWMGMMTDSLRLLAERLDLEDDVFEYDEVYQNIIENIEQLHWSEDDQMFCDVSIDDDDEPVFECHAGYISLFPMLLGHLSAESDKLGAILKLMRDPKRLWSDHGLRSLSPEDSQYGKGDNYWCGPIWLNINYLALRALYKYYIPMEGPHQALARETYELLRDRVVRTVQKAYAKQGYLYEQYSPEDGQGLRAHPFTGWSALVVLIMSEQYS